MKDGLRENALNRQAIIDKARSLFEKMGYERTSVKDIANACNFRPSNMYNYFSSKEEVLYHVLLEEASLIVDSIKHIHDDGVTSPVEQLKIIVENLASASVGSKSRVRPLFHIYFRDLLPQHKKEIMELRRVHDEVLCNVIERGITAGDFTPMDVNPACYAIYSMVVRSRTWFSPEDREAQARYVNFLFEFIIYGLAGDRKVRRREARAWK